MTRPDLNPGDLVIMLHPVMDRHVVGEVASVTAKSVNVYYWTRNGRNAETKLRRLDAIVAKAVPGTPVTTLVNYLDMITTTRTDAVKAAEAQYATGLKAAMEESN